MITVISRFRVADQKTAEVEQAFHERPHLVEKAAGFRGLEILQDSSDSNIFYLYTKWDSLPCYRAWHSSAAHRESHALIPKDLKLDPSYTKVEILYDEIPRESGALGAFLDSFLAASSNIIHLRLDQDGIIKTCSPAFGDAMAIPREDLIGRKINEFMVELDAVSFAHRLASGQSGEDFILNFSGSSHSPFSVRARLFFNEEGSYLIAERDPEEESILSRELIGLNNEFVRLSRDNQQKNRELRKTRDDLAQALEERDRSYWFVRKTLKVLPICLRCHKVKSSGTSWESLNDFLMKNSNFLSHGYCPDCLEKELSEHK
jgi:heme-degrading monooxygenase HmoA